MAGRLRSRLSAPVHRLAPGGQGHRNSDKLFAETLDSDGLPEAELRVAALTPEGQ